MEFRKLYLITRKLFCLGNFECSETTIVEFLNNKTDSQEYKYVLLKMFFSHRTKN